MAIGAGSQLQQPLAVAIISGLLVAVPLVLLAMPALYAWISERRLSEGGGSQGAGAAAATALPRRRAEETVCD